MSNIHIRIAQGKDAESIILLLEQFNPRVKSEKWRQLLNNPWASNTSIFGHVLLVDDAIIGFAGLVYSNRTINDKSRIFYNRSSTYIDRNHQGKGYGKIIYGISTAVYCDVMTAFSTNDITYRILRQYGFKTLDSHVLLFFPLPIRSFKAKITVQKDIILERLTEKEKSIYTDHQLDNCYHFVIYNANRYCYFVLTKKKFKKLTMGWIHYISDREVFCENIGKVLLSLCYQMSVYCIRVDRRLLDDANLKASITLKLAYPHLYKSDIMEPSHIDSLYSEYQLLSQL